MCDNPCTAAPPPRDVAVCERRETRGVWSVEIIDYQSEGDAYVTVFFGPESKARAESYALWCRSQ
jgi:hypothetical protein